MKRKEYRKLCDLAASGDHPAVINLENHEQGEVLSCHHDYFNVRVGEGWEVWDRRVCEPSLLTRDTAGQGTRPIDFQI